jgi:hypothetical protein
MKNLGGSFFTFLAYFYPKLGGKFMKVGGEVYQSWGEVYCNIMFSIGEPHRRKVWWASSAILMNNEKYTRSVSLRNGGRGQGWGEPCSMAFGGG